MTVRSSSRWQLGLFCTFRAGSNWLDDGPARCFLPSFSAAFRRGPDYRYHGRHTERCREDYPHGRHCHSRCNLGHRSSDIRPLCPISYVGGSNRAAVSTSIGAGGIAFQMRQSPMGDFRDYALFISTGALSGFLAGLVYWCIAGRSAGVRTMN
jgi:hypothetical protein